MRKDSIRNRGFVFIFVGNLNSKSQKSFFFCFFFSLEKKLLCLLLVWMLRSTKYLKFGFLFLFEK